MPVLPVVRLPETTPKPGGKGLKHECATSEGAAVGRDSETVDRLAGPLIEELTAAWARGERLRAEEVLARYALADCSEVALRVVFEEVNLRQEAGNSAASTEVFSRFPHWRNHLEAMLFVERAIHGPSPAFPSPGEMLGEFRLLSELGRGALGRVFLAEQPDLAGRPVVLKLCRGDVREHLCLARLQHTHIVPLYLAQDFPERGLRALCMPYLGGATLAQVLELLSHLPAAERTGDDIVKAADRQQPAPCAVPPGIGPGRKLLQESSYVQAVCRIAADLADALAYAHQRGWVHLDVKPSNVLVTADGEAMLLDFHLARPPLAAGDSPDRIGGTVRYMPPEQELAVCATRAGQPIPSPVDERADVYSLGLVLHEALGGAFPLRAELPERPLPSCNPRVSMGLADIVARCLAAQAADRYACAAELAADLRAHLADRPLVGVRNRSLTERWRKWRRRHPHAVRYLVVVAVLVSTIAAMGLVAARFVMAQQRKAESSLASGQQMLESREYRQAMLPLARGLAVAEDLPGGRQLKRTLTNELRELQQRAKLTAEAQAAANRLRFLDGIEAVDRPRTRQVLADCRRVWRHRGRIAAVLIAEQGAGLDQSVRTDLADLWLLWSDLELRLAPAAERPAARQQALAALTEVRDTLGRSPLLEWLQASHAQADPALSADSKGPASLPGLQTSWDHYAAGVILMRDGRLDAAEDELAESVTLRPEAFWPHFYRGVCAFRRGRPRDSVQELSVCAALSPDRSECFQNRGLAYRALGDRRAAERDLQRARMLAAVQRQGP